MALFSIIVPVYNVESYLRCCIESILSQTFADFELLLIDDGSSDSSGRICDEYAKKDVRIRVFHNSNKGVSSARNTGLDYAEGDWIVFVDSDDDIANGHLFNFAQLLNNCKADCYAIGCNAITTRNQYPSWPEDHFYPTNQIYEFIIATRKIGLFGVPWNKIFSNRLIQINNIRFDESLDSYEDEVFVMTYLGFASSVVTSSSCTYNYHIRKELTLSKKYIEINKHIRIANQLYELGKKFSSTEVFREHLKIEFARHLTESVARLYGLYTHFMRKERFAILSIIINASYEYGVDSLFFSQLVHRKIFSRNINIIDLNGELLYLCRRIKRYIGDTLKNWFN